MNECLTKELEHRFEFVDAGSGKSNWVCKMCGQFKIEYEDCVP